MITTDTLDDNYHCDYYYERCLPTLAITSVVLLRMPTVGTPSGNRLSAFAKQKKTVTYGCFWEIPHHKFTPSGMQQTTSETVCEQSRSRWVINQEACLRQNRMEVARSNWNVECRQNDAKSKKVASPNWCKLFPLVADMHPPQCQTFLSDFPSNKSSAVPSSRSSSSRRWHAQAFDN